MPLYYGCSERKMFCGVLQYEFFLGYYVLCGVLFWYCLDGNGDV